MFELNDVISCYILNANFEIEHATSTRQYLAFMQTKQRFLFYNKAQNIEVSTVFLGIDHAERDIKNDNHVPILFETMSFCHQHSLECVRCASYVEAKANHVALCRQHGIYYINLDNEPAICTITDVL